MPASAGDQKEQWAPDRWLRAFRGREDAHEALRQHSEQSGGITRDFIHAYADGGDPVALFLMAMAWGFPAKGYGPARTEKILAEPGAEGKIEAIVSATRKDGAAAGWHALLVTHKIKGLEMAFGTKLLYFAGYTAGHELRPLILDRQVRRALQDLAPDTVPGERRTVHQADYVRYLQLAEELSSNPAWDQEPDGVEFALFSYGKQLPASQVSRTPGGGKRRRSRRA